MSQTLNSSMLVAAALSPLVGAVVAGVFGTQLGGNKLGRNFAHSITIGG
jgi:NADH-quinone oxidoreductase subunit L